MRFIRDIREREAEIREKNLQDVPVVGAVSFYDQMLRFSGSMIEVDGQQYGRTLSYYPVTRKSVAEIYFTPNRIHYAFSDDNGFVRIFSIQPGADTYLQMFREGSKVHDILKGEYTLSESDLIQSQP